MISLKNNSPVSWYSWSIKNLESICRFYIKIEWCKRHHDKLMQYESLQEAVTMINNNKEKILSGIINKSPGLRQFLIIHSVFNIYDNKSEDWLVRLMIDELYPTDKEIVMAHKKDEIPDFIMDKLSIFDPKPLGFEKNLDNVKIHYKMIDNWEDGKYTDPITVIDRLWEDDPDQLTKEELEGVLSSYKNIKVG